MGNVDQRVGFLIAGAQKGGTSALSYYLRQHPEIAMSEPRECHFFDDDVYFSADPPDYGVYHRLFHPTAGAWLLGDCTPAYLLWPEAPSRVRAYNPGMKMIVLLRHPVFRAYSHWNMMRIQGHEPLSFAEAIDAEADRLATGDPRTIRAYSYLERGYYARQLARWFEWFPREQFLIMKREEIGWYYREFVPLTLRFLGVDDTIEITPKMVNVRPYEADIAPALLARLNAHFEPELQALEALLDWNCDDWRRADRA